MKVSPTFHLLGVAAVTVSTAAAVALSPAVVSLASGVRTMIADVALLDNVALIMGGSGTPIPSQSDLAAAGQVLDHLGYGDYALTGVFTPEGLYPGTGVKSLPLDTSVDQGVQIIDSTIREHLQAGDRLVVFGGSQSAVISSLEMSQLATMSEPPSPDQLAFVLVANEMAPNGGLLSRFAVPGVPLDIPSMGIDFYGAQPDDTPYATVAYTQEYDGFSDFPRYPLDLLATLNAVLGIALVHGTGYGPASIATAQMLLGSTDYDGPLHLPDGVSAALNTDYYMVPTQTLPLLEPLLGVPVLGHALYDLLEPVTRILVDVGYGNVDTYVDGELTHGGWDQGPANVLTPFGLFPQDIHVSTLLNSLAQGTEHGVEAFVYDLGHLSFGSAADAANSVADFSLPSFTDFVNTVTGAASTLYSQLLPLADVLTALSTSLPAYDISLFTHELQGDDGLLTNLVNAIGMPIAADAGLVPTAIGYDLLSILGAFHSVAADFAGLFSA